MFVNQHALSRLRGRLPPNEVEAIVARLEAAPGEPGIVGIILAHLAGEQRGDQGSAVEVRASNGDTLVAIVADGEVITIYYRRSWNQRLDAGALGVQRVVSWT